MMVTSTTTSLLKRRWKSARDKTGAKTHEYLMPLYSTKAHLEQNNKIQRNCLDTMKIKLHTFDQVRIVPLVYFSVRYALV